MVEERNEYDDANDTTVNNEREMKVDRIFKLCCRETNRGGLDVVFKNVQLEEKHDKG